MLYMQEVLLRLTQFWTERGCLTVQPTNTEVGAGTLNPATFLRVLGPEPWRVCYVEPSVRPDDARYGENPNRIQTHTQFQVILKPEPGNAQDLYLESLHAIGIDTKSHDIRFVEDNWASPALGAWGLGWEVWHNGLEITQFTYFQQAGGLNLDPVSVEITYGIERILMALQLKQHFKNIEYAPGFSYDDIFGQSEYEMSRYYLDMADVSATRTLFDTYEAEAQRMIEARLPIPAYSYVLKCSHAFNVLDARQAVSTTDRGQAFARIRHLAHEVAGLWVERRAEEADHLRSASAMASSCIAGAPAAPLPTAPSVLALEIGVEELPSAEVPRLAGALGDLLSEELGSTRLEHGEIRTHGTPRRLIALVLDVTPAEKDQRVEVRGPRVTAAYDRDGRPTPALLGFARAQGTDPSALHEVSIGGTAYIAALHDIAGRSAPEAISHVLPRVIKRLRGEKNMRWNAPGTSFSRPIRWLVALLGQDVVPFSAAGLTSSRSTHLHRNAYPRQIEIPQADGLLEELAKHGIIADREARQATIAEQAQRLAADAGGRVDCAGERDLVEEITDLVEQPVSVLGSFDPKYLDMPPAILTMVMRKHQRYLPVRDAHGGLLPRFVGVANGACDEDAVRAGNEAVLQARYEDAAFFWRTDLAVRPEEFRASLARLTFERQLGSVADRSARIAAIAGGLAASVDIGETESEVLRRAGELALFDLASQMVIELPSLSGIMAYEYALRAGEPVGVAQALHEMELPRHTGDALPTTAPGALLALAARLDLLAGLFAIGEVPTGSSDPFGLRRAALGIISIQRAAPGVARLSIRSGLELAAAHQPVTVSDAMTSEAANFVMRRYEQQLSDAGHNPGLIHAVLPFADVPTISDRLLMQLTELTGDEAFGALVGTMQRVDRIVPPETPIEYNTSLLIEPAETTLASAVSEVRTRLSNGTGTLKDFVEVAQALVAPVDRFFEEVLVMSEDPALKAARLGLLASVRDCGARRLDWSKLA